MRQIEYQIMQDKYIIGCVVCVCVLRRKTFSYEVSKLCFAGKT